MLSSQSTRTTCAVALPAEGVDRNTNGPSLAGEAGVALHAEGVDRNTSGKAFCLISSGRPPRGGRG